MATGDFNGNGREDIVLQNYDAGSILVIEGATSNFNNLTTRVLTGDTDLWWGYNVTVGDFNGDGRDDIAVSVDDFDKNPATDSDEGAIHIYLGGFTGISLTPNIVIQGALEDGFLGYRGISNLGDIDGNGAEDLGFIDSYGISYIFWGTNMYMSTYDLAAEDETSINFTFIDTGVLDLEDIIPLGDVDGDGFDDIGAISSGKIYVLYGQSDWETVYLDRTGLEVLEITVPTELNHEIYGLGDLDNDGLNEIIYGEYHGLIHNYNAEGIQRIKSKNYIFCALKRTQYNIILILIFEGKVTMPARKDAKV